MEIGNFIEIILFACFKTLIFVNLLDNSVGSYENLAILLVSILFLQVFLITYVKLIRKASISGEMVKVYSISLIFYEKVRVFVKIRGVFANFLCIIEN